MDHLLFTIWMLLYFPCKELADYLSYLTWGQKNREFSDDVRGKAAVANLVIYFFVAYLLY